MHLLQGASCGGAAALNGLEAYTMNPKDSSLIQQEIANFKVHLSSCVIKLRLWAAKTASHVNDCRPDCTGWPQRQQFHLWKQLMWRAIPLIHTMHEAAGRPAGCSRLPGTCTAQHGGLRQRACPCFRVPY